VTVAEQRFREPVLDGLALAVAIVGNIVASGLGVWPLWVSAPIVVVVSVLLLWARRRFLGSAEETVEWAEEELRSALTTFWEREAKTLGVNDERRLSVHWVEAGPGVADDRGQIDAWARRVVPDFRVTTSGDALDGHDAELDEIWLDRSPAGRLVLLGAGGSGKSDLMIGVVERLCARGRLPLLVPASSWNPLTTRVDDWIEHWLVTNYRFLRRTEGKRERTLARALIATHRIDLLVDGLDELPPGARRTAVQDLGGDRSFPHLLISSRKDEYRDAGARLAGAVAVRVENQTSEEVMTYLGWARFDGDGPVRAALDTPLMAMLADTIYNGTPRDHEELAGVRDIPEHLLDGFIPAAYPEEPRAERWLRTLAGPEIRWWDLGGMAAPRRRGLFRYAVVPAVVLAWTSLSAGVLNGFVFDGGAGVVDGLRVGTAALLCYVGILLVTGSGRAATTAALGAYIGGVISGSYDLAFAAGIAGGLGWRPLGRVRAGHRWALVMAALAVGGSVLIRVLDTAGTLPHEPGLVEGFAAGFADGMVSGWDQDVNGWVATAAVVGLLTLAGLRTIGGGRLRRPVWWAAALGGAVVMLDAWADGFRPHAHPGRLLAPADGLAVGLAIWVTATVMNRPSGRARPWIAPAVTVAAVALGILGDNAKGDVTAGWARGLADGLAAGFITLLALRRAADRPARVVEATPVRVAGMVLPALAAAAVLGGIAGRSAPVGVAIVYGLAFGALVLYGLAGRAGPTVEVGVFAAGIVGLVVAIPYGLIYGLLVTLATKIAQEMAARKEPAYKVGASASGIIGGAVLGAAVAAAAYYAGVGRPWIPFVWLSATLVLTVAFGTSGEVAGKAAAASPRSVLRRDRFVFFRSTLTVMAGVAAAVGVRTAAGHHDAWRGLFAALAALGTYGLTAGLTVAFAQSRYPSYALRVTAMAANGRLPWALMPFLDRAYEHRVLRRYGNVYRFRHPRLAEHLAGRGSAL
jgi:hypothetical protein